jgi:molecular chaperone Hsp33
LQGIQVIAESQGYVKGKVGNPAADLPPRESDGKIDVAGIVGNGALRLLHDIRNSADCLVIGACVSR